MKRQHLPLYAIALAVLVVGLAFAGVPVQAMLSGLLVVAWVLMMMLLMGDGHGGHRRSGQHVGHVAEHQGDPTGGLP